MFEKAGLEVTGIDDSGEMLKVCRKKKVAKKLIKLDFLRCLLPFDNNYFELVFSCGVFHLMGDLGTVFSEIARVLKPGGLVALTIDEWEYKKDHRFKKIPRKNIWQKTSSDTGITHYKHSRVYLEQILIDCRLRKQKKTAFLAFINPQTGDTTHFSAYTAIKD